MSLSESVTVSGEKLCILCILTAIKNQMMRADLELEGGVGERGGVTGIYRLQNNYASLLSNLNLGRFLQNLMNNLNGILDLWYKNKLYFVVIN